MIAERVREAQVWWLFSELSRRSPTIRLRGVGPDSRRPGIVEVHHGISHVVIALDSGPFEAEIVDSLLSAESAHEAVRRWAVKVGASADPVGPTRSHVLTYRVLAETAQRNVTGRSKVRVQSAEAALVEFGLESDFLFQQGGPAEWGPFASAIQHVQARTFEFAPDVSDPIAACWVVMVDDRPVLLVDDGAWAHDTLGGHTNLARIYGAKRSISDVYEKANRGAMHQGG